MLSFLPSYRLIYIQTYLFHVQPVVTTGFELGSTAFKSQALTTEPYHITHFNCSHGITTWLCVRPWTKSITECILIIYKMFHRTCSHIPCSLSFTNSLIWKFQASRTWKKEERKGSTLSFIKGEHASLFFSFALQMCKYIITGTTVYTIILNQSTTLLINFSVRMKFVKTILTFDSFVINLLE